MECPGEIEVLAWMHGGLPAVLLDRLDTHIDRCGDCLATVAALGKTRAVTAPGTDTDRYVLGDELARGGMGQVFVATDRVLGRPVVVKTARDARAAARFAREMRITARLQHPAIVPVYDAGAFPDGEPFYVMRHVEGRTLDRAAAEAAGLDDRLALLPAVMTAIDAVAYAHDCGVIHRDLKPANVLVGRFGETIVLDWGLAKAIDDRDDAGAAVAGTPDPAAEPALTHAGAVLGTPAYMAPEQLGGEPADARTDVYGLGAIVYHVLAGAPPKRVATEPLIPLAIREPGVPPELAAIVDRAMAAEPGDRYPTANDLADDLRRYLTGRLVAAHHYSAGALVRRWAGRHRAALIAAAIALAATVAIGVVAIRRVVVARDDAQSQRALAVANQRASDTHRDAAEQLVALVLDDLKTRLEAMGRLDALVEVGRAIDDYYGRIPVRPGPDGIDALLRRADALATLGDARFALGDLDGADAAFSRQVELAVDASARRDDDRSRGAPCLARLRLGDVARARGDLAAARAAHAACVDLTDANGNPRLQDLVIQALVGVAEVDRLEGKYDHALAMLARAEPLAAALDRADTLPAHRGRMLAMHVTGQRGNVAIDRGDIATARAAFAANRERAEQAVIAAPGDAEAQRTLVDTLLAVARGERRADDLVAAAVALTRALAINRKLVERDPDNLDWVRELGTALSQLGSVELDRGDLAAAEGYLVENQAISERLARITPDNLAWARDVSVGALQLGDLQRARGRFAEARASLVAAVTVSERLSGLRPDDAELRRDLAITLLHLGDLDRERGRSDAVATLERMVAIMRELVEHAGMTRARTDLVGGLLALSDAQPGPAARATIEAARAVLEPLRDSADAAADNAELRQAFADVDEAAAAAKTRK